MSDGPNTSTKFAMCSALYDIPFMFPDSPENGLVFYSFLLVCAMLIILYCLLRIRRQRSLLRKGEIRVMKQWLLPIYYSFLWFCVIIYAIKAIDICIVFLFFVDQFQRDMPFVAALFHAASFWTSSFWLFNVILLFLASNSHGTQTIRRAFWISTSIWMVSIVVITMGIEIPTNEGFLNFCAIYGLQCFIVIGVMSFMCLRAYPHHQYIWTLSILFLLECSCRFAADYFRYRSYDAFCLMDIADYISSLIMPWVIIHTLRQDSKHWSNLSVWMQAANRGSIYNTFSLHVMGHERQSMTVWSELLSQHTQLLKSEMLIPIIGDRRLIGGSGQVTRARYKGNVVAVKEWRFERFTKHVIALWCKEALISSNFRHKNIVKLIGICIEPPSIKIVMDWCKYGSLRKLLISRKSISWSERYSFLIDVANGMHHLHRNGLVHRDLKTLNLLVDEDINGNRFLRICDFGSSRSVDLDQYYQEYSQQQSTLSFASTAYTTFTNDIITNNNNNKIHENGPILSPNSSKMIPYGATNSKTPPIGLHHSKKSSSSGSVVGKLKNLVSGISGGSRHNSIKSKEGNIDGDLSYFIDGSGRHDDEKQKTNNNNIYNNDMSITSHLLHQVTSQMSTIVGSVQFLAPEILRNIEFKPNSRSAKSKGNSLYGFSADVYSYGCVIWEIVTRREIYKGKSYSEIQKFVLNNNRPLVLGSELQNCLDGNFIVRLMNQCWQADALARPNFQQIIQMLEDRKDRFIEPTHLLTTGNNNTKPSRSHESSSQLSNK